MPLTKKEVIMAAGQYPHLSDEELLDKYGADSGNADRSLALGIACMVMMFVAGAVMTLTGDANLTGLLSQACAALIFVFLIGFGAYMLIGSGHAKDSSDALYELKRRGVPIPEQSE